MRQLILALILLVVIPSALCITTLVVNETELVKLKVNAKDKDGDLLNYTFSSPLNASGEWQTTYDDSGKYLINVTASDGKTNTTQQVLLVVKDVNQAPVIKIKDVNANEGELVKLEPEATDPNNDSVKIKYSEPFDKNGKWQTGYDDSGKYDVTITATDGKLNSSKKIEVTINDVNVAPVVKILPSNNVEILETETAFLEADSQDLDKDALSYKWYINGELVSEENKYDFTTDYNNSGVYDVILEVSDKETSVKSDGKIIVKNLDRKPEIDLYDSITINEGDVLDFDLPSKDADGDLISYTISEPVGDDQVWETGYNDSGIYKIKITADDGQLKTNTTIKVTVLDVDQPPAVNKIVAQVKEGENLKVKLNAVDPDGDKVEYNITDAPFGVELKKDVLEWTPDYDAVKIKTNWLERLMLKFGLMGIDHNQSKIYAIKLKAIGKEKSTDFEVVVAVWNVNRAPVIDIPGTLEYNETDLIELKPVITDPDNETLIVDFSGALEKTEYKSTYEDAGKYETMITATDGDLAVAKNVTIVIHKKNRAPKILTESALFYENKTGSVQIKAADPDKEDKNKLSIDAVIIPEHAKFKNNTLTFTPGFDYVSHTDFGLKKSEIAVFNVTDGIDVVTKNITITVIDTNVAPVIQQLDEITGKENEKLYIPVNVSDPDGDTVYLKFAGFVYKNNQTLGFETEGKHNITVTASDGKLKSSILVPVDVLKTNRAPMLLTRSVVFKENATGSVKLNAFDLDKEDLNKLKITAVNVPKGAVVENNTLKFTPGFDYVSHNVSGWFNKLYGDLFGYSLTGQAVFNVTDREATVTKNVTITVKDTNRAPVISPLSALTAKENEKLYVPLIVYEEDGDKVTVSFFGLIQRNNQTIGFGTHGDYNLTVVASDGKLSSALKVPVTVLKTDRAPKLELEPATPIIYENETVKIKLLGTDPDNDKLSYNMAVGPKGAAIIDGIFYWKPGFEVVSHNETAIEDNKTVTKKIDLRKVKEIRAFVPLSIEVTDGELSALANTTITVIDVDRAPIILNLTPYQKFTTISGTTINFTIDAYDPDGDDIVYTWMPDKKYVDGPSHMRLVVNPGIKTMKVRVADGRLASETEWTYAVNPVQESAPVQQVVIQQTAQPQPVPQTQTFVIEG